MANHRGNTNVAGFGLVCYWEMHTFGDVKLYLLFVGPCL